jgi:hypothetical protein
MGSYRIHFARILLATALALGACSSKIEKMKQWKAAWQKK